MPPVNNAVTLNKWKKRVNNCQKCDIAKICKHKVLERSTSKKHIDILFVGEAPGETEYINKLPFIGPAGQTLKNIIEEALEDHPDLTYSLINSIFCTPFTSPARANIRTPSLSEVKECSQHLYDYIEIYTPKVIIAVGEIAHKALAPYTHFHIMHTSAINRSGKRYQYEFDKAVLTIQGAIDNVFDSE